MSRKLLEKIEEEETKKYNLFDWIPGTGLVDLLEKEAFKGVEYKGLRDILYCSSALIWHATWILWNYSHCMEIIKRF